MRKLILPLVASLVMACNDDSPLEPLTVLSHANASPSCGPADGPATLIFLASTAELPPVAPFIQVFVPRRFTEGAPGAVFQIGEDFNEEASAWFHRSGVEMQSARRGEVGITSLQANQLTGYVDLLFPDGTRMRGSFTASWQDFQILCG